MFMNKVDYVFLSKKSLFPPFILFFIPFVTENSMEFLKDLCCKILAKNEKRLSLCDIDSLDRCKLTIIP